jgi:hypothetical protein
MPVKEPVDEDKKRVDPVAALVGFLALLNRVSMSPAVREFCTPGHKAGRGFAPTLVAKPAEEVR